jgi:hypothetical protein
MQQYQQAANVPAGRGFVNLAAQSGGMLGDALSSAAGYQDPRMAAAMQDQQVQQQAIEQAKMQGINPAEQPEEFLKLYANTWMQAGKPDKSFPIVQQLQAMQAQKSKMGLESAQAQAALHKATQEADPVAKLAQTGKFAPASLAAFQQSKDYGDLLLVDGSKPMIHEIGVPGQPNMKQTNISYDNGRTWQPLGGPVDLRASATSVTVQAPEIKALGQLQNVRSDYLKETAPYRETLDKVDTALSIAGQAGNNAFATKVLPNVLADIYGGSQKAQAEITRLQTMGTITDRVAQRALGFLAGTTTDVQVKEILPVLKAAKKLQEGRIKQKEGQYRKRSDIRPEDMDFITASEQQPTQQKEPMPNQLRLGNTTYPVTKNNLLDTILRSNISREEKMQMAKLAKDNGWVD